MRRPASLLRWLLAARVFIPTLRSKSSARQRPIGGGRRSVPASIYQNTASVPLVYGRPSGERSAAASGAAPALRLRQPMPAPQRGSSSIRRAV